MTSQADAVSWSLSPSGFLLSVVPLPMATTYLAYKRGGFGELESSWPPQDPHLDVSPHRDGLPIVASLHRRNIFPPFACVFCTHQVEITQHLFLECPVLVLLWSTIVNLFRSPPGRPPFNTYWGLGVSRISDL